MEEAHIFVQTVKAEKSKGLERSLKTAIPKEIYEQLEEEMEAIEK